MGISRNMQVERRVNGVWQHVPPPTNGVVFSGHWDSEASNDVFAALCNDYRRYGKFELVAPLRGLPGDMSKPLVDILEYFDERWCMSWYTLAELLAFDWDKPVLMNEKLCGLEYVELKEQGKIVAEHPAFEKFIADKGLEVAGQHKFGQPGVVEKVEYNSTYREQAVNFFHDVEKLLALGANPQEIRLVVWCSP